MTEKKGDKFFQNETKFEVGKTYETLGVKTPPYGTYKVTMETCDEVGTIIPNSERFLGKYVSSQKFGYGDNSNRCDTFINDKGEYINNYLNYDGSTRFREVKRLIDERLAYLSLFEGVQNVENGDVENADGENADGENKHIEQYVLNELLVKEICSFMNPEI